LICLPSLTAASLSCLFQAKKREGKISAFLVLILVGFLLLAECCYLFFYFFYNFFYFNKFGNKVPVFGE